MTTRVLLVGTDLNAIARLEATGATVRTARSGTLEAALKEPSDVVVVDLDAGGEALLEELRALRAAGALSERVICYFSHIDESLGKTARDTGFEAVPRGRFWRTAADLLRPE